MPTASLSRRDSQVAGKGLSNHRGFTVTELMVAVAVVAIITSLALPSYRTLIEKRQVTSGAEQIAAFLSAVQIESVMRNENLTVSYDRDEVDDWCIGLKAGTTACDCHETDPAQTDYCEVDTIHRVLSSSSLTYPNIMDSMIGDGSFSFDPVRGLLVNPDDVVEMQLVSDAGNFALNVEVGPTGRVRICSGSSTSQVPGYVLC